MTDQEKNALIAKAASADPDWEKWAYETVRCSCPSCVYGALRLGDRFEACDVCGGKGTETIPRDFADKRNMPDLIEWAYQQAWCDAKTKKWIFTALELLVWMGVKAKGAALQVRDTIANRLKEIADGN